MNNKISKESIWGVIDKYRSDNGLISFVHSADFDKLSEEIFELVNESPQLELKELKDALSESITGLEWWVDSFPEGYSREDDDKINDWKKLIK